MISDATVIAILKAAPKLSPLELIELVVEECRIAQQKQEPVAWMNKHGACMSSVFEEVDETAGQYTTPLYTSPPQRQWVGLTDDERDNIINQAYDNSLAHKGIDTDLEIAKNIEAKLKEKNG